MRNARLISFSAGIGILGMAAAAWPATAAAAVVWDQAAVTCQELISPTGANDLVSTVNTPAIGGGFAMQDSAVQATVTLYCPVWIPNATTVRAIQIRYIDTNAQGAVRAIFYRQAWTTGGGAAAALGSVTSLDSGAIPSVVGSNLPVGAIINNNQFSYLIRVELHRDSTAAQVRILQVRLLDSVLAGVGEVGSDVRSEIDCEKAAASGWKTEEERAVCLGG